MADHSPAPQVEQARPALPEVRVLLLATEQEDAATSRGPGSAPYLGAGLRRGDADVEHLPPRDGAALPAGEHRQLGDSGGRERCPWLRHAARMAARNGA